MSFESLIHVKVSDIVKSNLSVKFVNIKVKTLKYSVYNYLYQFCFKCVITDRPIHSPARILM